MQKENKMPDYKLETLWMNTTCSVEAFKLDAKDRGFSEVEIEKFLTDEGLK
jgi:hypothetical protein